MKRTTRNAVLCKSENPDSTNHESSNLWMTTTTALDSPSSDMISNQTNDNTSSVIPVSDSDSEEATAPRTSYVSQYVTFLGQQTELSLDNKEKETRLYKCQLCEKEKIIRCHPSSTANIKKHLEKCHNINEFRKRRKKEDTVNRKIIRLPVNTNDALSAVEDISFQEFIVGREREEIFKAAEILKDDILTRFEQFRVDLSKRSEPTTISGKSEYTTFYEKRCMTGFVPVCELSPELLSIENKKEEIKLILKNVNDPEQIAEILALRMKEMLDETKKATDEAKKELERRKDSEFQLEQLKNQFGIIEVKTIIDEIEIELLHVSPVKSKSEMLEILTEENKAAIKAVIEIAQVEGSTEPRGSGEDDISRIDAGAMEKSVPHFIRWSYFFKELRNNMIIKKILEKVDDPIQFSRSLATVFAKLSPFTHFCPVVGISHDNMINSLKLHKFPFASIHAVKTILNVMYLKEDL